MYLAIRQHYPSLCYILYGELSFAAFARYSSYCPRKMIAFEWFNCEDRMKVKIKMECKLDLDSSVVID